MPPITGRYLALSAGEMRGPGESVEFFLPSGWHDERLLADPEERMFRVHKGLARPRSKSQRATVVVQSLWQAGPAQVDAWTRALRVTNIAWSSEGPAVSHRDGLRLEVTTGTAHTLSGETVRLYRSIVAVDGESGHVLMVGALLASATLAEERELHACMARLRKR